ncbi:NADPH-dependent FMN reductase [Companilactobacillus jidongensis]|uniref:NADPH-dependent FMN reductase n=1 Tax=Companilactobacillus jidongensis TaxID=2486006 RepID=UPI000F786715|nr:NADPH-dependent FMN reductase [Companilactobacillus jidongensis]
MKQIGIIVGSNRPTRVSLDIATWVQTTLQDSELNYELIDLEKINLPFLDEPDIPAHGNYQNEHTKEWASLVNSFDGFIIVYPQYNWGYPAVLKNALDYLYTEWAHKPVSTIVFGAHGGYMADLALSFVLKGLHMNVLNSKASLNIVPGQPVKPEIDFKQNEFAIEQIGNEFKNILRQ